MELGQVTLSDGRRVDTYTGGDPDGPAVILQHGMPQCRLVATHVEDGAYAAGVRLLALSRPGFGHSSPANPSLAACGRDAVEVATLLGAETFSVLGISFGAPFAAATAIAGPERVTALGICVGMGPWAVLDADDPDLAPELEILALDDHGHPDESLAAYRELMSGVFDEMLSLERDEQLMDAFDAIVSPDGTPAEDTSAFPPEWRDRFARDIREALTSYDGIAHDNIATGRPWDIDPSTIHQPTHLWYGADDHLLPIEHARWWQAQIPHAQLTVRPGTGHGGAFIVHSADMLRTLATAVW
jgi:pimeloyl-ACP methyl ester carboxylesterase